MERNDSDCDFDGSMSAEISLVEGGTESSNSSTSSSCSGMCCNSIISVYQQNKHFIGGFVETEKNWCNEKRQLSTSIRFCLQICGRGHL